MILHEYGHAIQDAQVRWFGYGNQAGAIGEGFGDYWAAAMSSRSPGTSNRDDVCIFDWDGISSGELRPRVSPQVRPARGQRRHRCPRPRRPVRSARSGAWARSGRARCGTCATRSAAKAFDRILLSSQFMYTTNEHFDDAVEALIAADQASTQGANKDPICAEMEIQRGISVADCP